LVVHRNFTKCKAVVKKTAIFDEGEHKRKRSCVGRFFAWLKGGFRRLAIRYERLATYMGFLHLAALMMH